MLSGHCRKPPPTAPRSARPRRAPVLVLPGAGCWWQDDVPVADVLISSLVRGGHPLPSPDHLTRIVRRPQPSAAPPPSLAKGDPMPRVIVTTDPSQLPRDVAVLLDEQVHTLHLSSGHAAAQPLQR